jgi:RNA polymerase sigma-70 factor (ECF subfamily)
MQGATAMDHSGVAAAAGGELDREPPGDDADAEALRRLADGDLGRFDEFVARHKTHLFRHIHRRIRDPHRAEDLTQETFLRLFRAARAGGYTGQARVVTWLFNIAGNCVTDHLRAEGLRASVRVVREQADSQDPLDAAAEREGESRVRRLLLELPEEQRVVVELKILDGLTFGEIAELLGCPIPTVKSRLVYALRKLKRSLDESESRRSQS